MNRGVELVANLHHLLVHAKLAPNVVNLFEEQRIRVEQRLFPIGHPLWRHECLVNFVGEGYQPPERVLLAEVLCVGRGVLVLPPVILQLRLKPQEVVHNLVEFRLGVGLLLDEFHLGARGPQSATFVALVDRREVLRATLAADPFFFFRFCLGPSAGCLDLGHSLLGPFLGLLRRVLLGLLLVHEQLRQVFREFLFFFGGLFFLLARLNILCALRDHAHAPVTQLQLCAARPKRSGRHEESHGAEGDHFRGSRSDSGGQGRFSDVRRGHGGERRLRLGSQRWQRRWRPCGRLSAHAEAWPSREGHQRRTACKQHGPPLPTAGCHHAP
mmetsp:Transcript_95201/g.269043  ORF Transcript_95201/g.269043 Transcript_95201/m.269043 type:complete len:327 (+) Transcript_95201:592-1572(+)